MICEPNKSTSAKNDKRQTAGGKGVLTTEALLAAVKVASRKCPDRYLTLARFQRLSGLSKKRIQRAFPAGWRALQKHLGLKQTWEHWSEDELLKRYHRAVRSVGGMPTWAQFLKHADCTLYALQRCFGKKERLLARYWDWLAAHGHPIPAWLPAPQSRPVELPLPPACLRGRAPGFTYGPALNFRNLGHAPTNEAGVLFLFALVSAELGFFLHGLHTIGFPDADALRLIDKRKNHWQRVRIEFEFRSSNFKRHRHDPDQCDLIVCWKHDWPECPLEVIELRKVVKKLAEQETRVAA
jgi:hypothetical protein